MPTAEGRKVLAWGVVIISAMVFLSLAGFGLYLIDPTLLLVVGVMIGCVLWVWAFGWAIEELRKKK